MECVDAIVKKKCGEKNCLNVEHFSLEKRVVENIFGHSRRKKTLQDESPIPENIHCNTLFDLLRNQITHPLTSNHIYFSTLFVQRIPITDMPIFNPSTTKEKMHIHKITAILRL